MNYPDKRPICQTFADNHEEKVKILYSLNAYESAIKPQIESLESERDQLKEDNRRLQDGLESTQGYIDMVHGKNKELKAELDKYKAAVAYKLEHGELGE